MLHLLSWPTGSCQTASLLSWVPVKRRAVVYKSSIASSHHLFSQWFILNGLPPVFLSHRTVSLNFSHACLCSALFWNLWDCSSFQHDGTPRPQLLLEGATTTRWSQSFSHHEVGSRHLAVSLPFPGRMLVLLVAIWHPCEVCLFSMHGWTHFSWGMWSPRWWGLKSKRRVLPSQLLF